MNLIISFTDQSASFTYGVEFGRVLAQMEQGYNNIHNNSFPVRIENKEVIQKACSHYGYIAAFGDESNGWVEFVGIKNNISLN